MITPNPVEKLLRDVKASMIKDLLYANQREMLQEVNEMLRVFAISLEGVTELIELFPTLNKDLDKSALITIGIDVEKLLNHK